MKRILIIVAAGLVAAGSLSAQAFGPRAQGVAPQTQDLETVKVDGRLALINGMIGVQSAGKTYYVGGLNRLIGFVDGLKEGASVKLEGYALQVPAAPEYFHLRATKLTFAGKDYDLSNSFGRGAMGGMMGPQGGMMDGRGMGGRSSRGGRW